MRDGAAALNLALMVEIERQPTDRVSPLPKIRERDRVRV